MATRVSNERGQMIDRGRRGGPDPALLHFHQAPLDSPVPSVDRIHGAIQDAIDAMLAFLGRTGYPAITAPQLGFLHRIVAVDLAGTGRSAIVLIDPVIRAVSPEWSVDLEGCLSLPEVVARIARPQRVRIEGRARTGQRVTLDAGGILARILQHKLEHLDGRLFLELVPSRERTALLSAAEARRPTCRLAGSTSRLPGAA